MRLHLIFFILSIFSLPKAGISQFYEVSGPLDVSYCSFETNYYGIETSEELISTTWITIPGTTTIVNNTYSAEIQFYSPGTYTLIVTSLTVNQLLLVDTLTIFVYEEFIRPNVIGCYELDADTDPSCYEVCAFSQTIVEYPGTSVEWEIIGAESYTFLNSSSVEITWGAGGSGTVFLYSQNCNYTLCFTILPEPVADFTTTPAAIADTLTVCKNQEVYFENQSFNGLNYTWQFGDGAQSNGYDASHTFTSEGYYTVTLAANSVCDCHDEKQIVVEVLPTPAPTLDCVNSVCPESRQRYTVTPSGCAQYAWNISSNGTIVHGGELTDDFIEVIWHEGPDGFIELSVSGCGTEYCSFTNIFRVPIISPEGPIDGDAHVCSGEIATYTAPYFPGTVYQWNIGSFGSILGGQGTNGIVVKWDNVNTQASSSVSVDYNNCFLECGGSDVMQVDIVPAIRLTGDVQVCQNETATVMAEAGFSSFSPANVNWHIEDAIGNIVFTQPGEISSLTHAFNYPPGEYVWVARNSSASYCNEIIRLSIFVTAIPDTPLGITGEEKICPGQPYGFTINPAGDFATQWLVTDGTATTTYAGQTIQHTFGPTPPYVVQASHADIQYMACVSDPVSVTLGSAADLLITGPDEVCYNGIDSFSTEYISGADYIWEVIPADHGEIRRSDLNQVAVFWTQSGNVTLRLNACGVIIDKAILVRAQPSFTVVGPTAACTNELVSLTTDQPLLAHVWVDDTDNIISVIDNVQLNPGSYGVQLTDAFGCSAKKSVQIDAYPAPVVHLSSAYDRFFCATIPGGVEIVANTDGTDYAYMWYLDDILIGPGGPIFTVNTFGEYHVEVTNQYGCKTISAKISFEDCCPPGPCGFGPPGNLPGCAFPAHNFSITFDELECNIHEYAPLMTGVIPGSVRWYIRSGSEGVIDVLTSDVFLYTYQKPGYYHITMTAELNGFPYDMNICGHYQNMTDTVRAVADFKYAGHCAAAPVLFEDLTTFLPLESIASWSWDFGDPASGADNNSTFQNPSHIYANGGTYEVTLTVELVSGCTTVKKIQVPVSEGPVLMPVYDAFHCEDEAMAFQLPGQVYDIQWVFGDPTSGPENMAISDSVMHTFDTPGSYWVTVAGSDIHSCMSAQTFMVDITANLLAGIIDVDPILPLCASDTATLTSPTGGLSWLWSTSETTSQIDVTESNQYNVFITDQFKCTYSPPPAFVAVFPKPEVIIKAREIYGPDTFGPWSSSLEICAGTEFEISAFSTGSVSYQWTTGEVTQVLQFTNEGSNLPAPGLLEFTVTTTNLSNNCISDSSMILIEIYELPEVPVISLLSGTGCSFNPNILQVTNPEAGSIYTWSDGQVGSSITVDQAGAYQVSAMNEHGCIATSNTIIINPSAPVDQLPGGCFIECDPLEVCLPPLTDLSSFTIYQDGNVLLSGTTWPSDFTITSDGSYTIEVTSQNGCVATSDPLDVVLYTGVGSLTVETWLDQDGDGMISSGDVLLSGIPVIIVSDDGLHTGETETIPDGQFVFVDYPATSYLAHIDRTLLSSQYMVVIDSVNTQITTCGDSVVVSLLLTENCIALGPDQFYELCPGELLTIGDSTWTDTGTYVMHMSSVSGCDSIFQVSITIPDSLEINVVVWVDVDQNGIVSPADTVVQGITVILDRQIGQSPYTGITDVNGIVNGIFPSAHYVVYIDTMLLPSGLMVLYGEDFIADTACGTVEFNFLLVSTCPAVFVVLQETLCPGDSIMMYGQWLSETGQYTFIQTDTMTMCDTIIDVYVTVTEEIMLDAVIGWSCDSLGSIELDITGEGPFMIAWGHGINGDTLVTGLDAGDYTVMITDINGCVVNDTMTIVAAPLLSFSVPTLFQVEEGDSVLITISGDVQEPGLTYVWTPASILSCPTCPSSYATPNHDTLITIEITDAGGCVYTLETFIMITTDTASIDEIYVPNVFSPNGDGINDNWKIYSKLANTYVHELKIYDRWGSVVFSDTDFEVNALVGWDGTLNGKALNPGVFVFHATLTLGDGKEVVVKGDITLVR